MFLDGGDVFHGRASKHLAGKIEHNNSCGKALRNGVQVSGDPRDIGWHGANAIGVPMGHRSGLLAIDIDDYKPSSEASSWLETHQLPATRTHRTASGGTHLIYRLPPGTDLGNHAPPVTGLNIRGRGGFIVWADIDGYYGVLDGQLPVELPDAVCRELLARRAASGTSMSDKDLPRPQYVPEDALNKKLTQLLSHPDGKLVRARFEGSGAVALLTTRAPCILSASLSEFHQL